MLESVQAVGKDLKFGVPGASAFGTPSLLVERLDIAGKDECRDRHPVPLPG